MQKTKPKKSEHAVKRFSRSMNCSQAVFETFAPSMGVEIETARRIAAAFAGGMGMGAECGAVTGALMVIGMKYGKTKDRDPNADEKTFAKLVEFIEAFKARHDHVICSALLDTDMGTPEGIKEAERKGYISKRCPKYVSSSVEILENIFD